MAELLQALFSRIRRPRQSRRQQWEPVSVQGGSSPGMRGSINPLDSVAMSDSAQGVDISSVAPPTRLASSRMDEAYQPQEAAQAASPFMFASQKGGTPAQPVNQGGVRYEKQCGPNGCQMVPVFDDMPAAGGMPMMQQAQANALPEGVTLGPGETFVPGSLREITGRPATASAPMASAAPAAAAPQQPAPAAAMPQEMPGPAAGGRMTPDSIQSLFAPALATADAAYNAPSARHAVMLKDKAAMQFRQAEIAVRMLQAREFDAKSDALEAELRKRGVERDKQKDPVYQLDQYQKAISNIRGDMSRSIADRASAVTEYKMMRTPNMKYEPQFVSAAAQEEAGIIFAMDASQIHSMLLDQNIDEGAHRVLSGRLVQSAVDQFSTVKTPEELRRSIDASLRQPFYHASLKNLEGRGADKKYAQAQAAVQADDAVKYVYDSVTKIRTSGHLYSPRVSAPPPKAPPPQQAPARQELEPVRETNPLGFLSPQAFGAAPQQPF